MKIVEKISLVLFSNIILILSALLCFILFGWLDFDVAASGVKHVLLGAQHVTLGVCIIFILLAIKCIFFDTRLSDSNKREGILLENENGKLLVSRDTLENLANGIAKGFENTENISSKIILDKENNVVVNVTLSVRPGTVIKELSNNLQSRIKEAIKTSIDLDVKEVNVRVKNIAPKQEQKEE